MQIASSAIWTCIELASISEYTATVRMFNSLQARMMRTAISPRLATRIFSNMILEARPSSGPDAEHGLAKFDGFGVFDEDMRNYALGLRFDLVHHFHGFDQADD